MKKLSRTKPYSNEFVLLIVAWGLVFAVSGSILVGFLAGLVTVLVYFGFLVRKELARRRAFHAWFHNNRGLDNLTSMTPLAFEQFVAELFTRLGYTTRLTPRSGDEGIDILAEKDGKKYAIQVKKSAKPVGSPVIQTLCGSMVHAKVDYGICVSATRFTSEAKRFAWGKHITLLGRDELIELLQQVT